MNVTIKDSWNDSYPTTLINYGTIRSNSSDTYISMVYSVYDAIYLRGRLLQSHILS